MENSITRFIRVMLVAALLCAAVTVQMHAEELQHKTQTDFAPGDFFQTVLEGGEGNPELRLDSYYISTTIFEDDTIGAWSYDTNTPGNIAEEDPEGQIHLSALYGGSPNGSWAYASWSDIAIPERLNFECLLYIDAMDSSGVEDPFAEQPTGACCRLDVLRTDVGFRMEIFRDRMVSFYREGETGIDYPVTASIDSATNTGQWYTIRCEIDFTDPDLAVQVYRDDAWIGELKADTRNAVPAWKIRTLAFSRGSSSGLAEMHVDYVKVGSMSSTFYGTGTYTSEVLDLGAISLDTFSWTEVPADPHPWEGWTKYAGNPVLLGPALAENMLVDIEDPLQQPIQYDGRYWLCYSSGGPGQTIRCAYTTDPDLLSWTDYEGNPVLAPIAGERYVFSPHLFKDGDNYYLFYDVALESDSLQRIAYATAPAPTGPWTRGQIIVDLGDPSEWDDHRVTEPFVIKEGGTYYLFHMGEDNCTGCGEQIGLVTTPDSLFPLGPEAGGLWTEHGVVFPSNPTSGEWDFGYVSNPSVIKYNGAFFMRYSGSNDNVHWKLGAAWATDPHGPWHRPEGVDIDTGPPGSWDDEKLLRGALHYHNGTWYCVYTGANEPSGWPSYQGGIATAGMRALGDSLIFETRSGTCVDLLDEWLPVTNGGAVQSAPSRYFQYRATFNLSAGELSPTLTNVSMTYVPGATPVEEPPPLVVRMLRPFPNPFNPSTMIGFTINRRQAVRLAVYDARGGRVALLADRTFEAGYHEVGWDGTNLEGRGVSSGVYFVRLQADYYNATKRMVLIR
jgi:hypothetical protein